MLTLDRPQALNALDVPTLEALRERLAQIRDDSNQRCVLIRGAGERAFCTGADLKGAKSEASASRVLHDSRARAGPRRRKSQVGSVRHSYAAPWADARRRLYSSSSNLIDPTQALHQEHAPWSARCAR
ncbi:enoyl-CoA hydratase/isomerase family protein [Variovorax soli]|uniref:enoyl-CoA hydratase/isomerase family protein n=1 Tax=Variovorax soli TaxID=376815 RepID=UPI003868ED1F